MKEKKDCKIVQDLLPNYIENLTNEETNKFIDEHLKECNECQKIFENMKKDFKVNTTKRDEREVKYIKKYSKKMKLLKTILLFIVVIYVVVITRRTIIMTSLSGKVNENQAYDNYYARLYSYQGDTLTITESYNKGNEQFAVTEAGGKKTVIDSKKMLGGNIAPVTYVSDGFLVNLQYALVTGIESTYCNGKECYVFKGSSYERYIDKETGFAIRDIEKSNKEITRQTDMVVDYDYKFNIVTDSDIIRPDITVNTINE